MNLPVLPAPLIIMGVSIISRPLLREANLSLLKIVNLILLTYKTHINISKTGATIVTSLKIGAIANTLILNK